MDSPKLEEVLLDIKHEKMVLPALQRKFVWNHEQIEKLFDSIYRGFPIGTVLSWERHKEDIQNSRDVYYKFLSEYSAYDSYINKKLSKTVLDKHELEIILDGQQRLSSLYLGIQGTYAYRTKGGKKDKKESYPIRELYFNLEADYEELADEDYSSFKFLTNKNEIEGHWIKVKDVYQDATELNNLSDIINSCSDEEKKKLVTKNYNKLANALNSLQINIDRISHKKTMDEVLNIFVRANDGGTKLSKADLLFSNLTIEWEEARDQVDELIELIRKDYKFYITSDFIMRAAIYCVSDDIQLKVEELKKKATLIKDKWKEIEQATKSAFAIVSENWGFNDDDIRAKYSIIPLIHLCYDKKINSSMKDTIPECLKIYIVVSNIKGIFGGSPDTVLSYIKKNIGSNIDNFKIDKLSTYELPGKRNFVIREKDIDDILEIEKGEVNSKLVLSLLYPGLNNQFVFHQDHMHPESICKNKKNIKDNSESKKMNEDTVNFIKENYNKIANLQLLEGTINESKNCTPLEKWVNDKHSNDKESYLKSNYVDVSVSLKLDDFVDFYNKRRDKLFNKFKEIFKV